MPGTMALPNWLKRRGWIRLLAVQQLLHAALAQWVIGFDVNRGVVASFISQDGNYNLTSPWATWGPGNAYGNVPTLFDAAGSVIGPTAWDAPCAPLGQDSWQCSGRASTGGTDTCGNPSQVRVQYTIALQQQPSNATGTGAVLRQDVVLTPLTPGCTPQVAFAVLLPRAVLLTTAASTAPGGPYERRVTGHYSRGVPFDLPVASSETGDYNGWVFVSAGEAWMPPGKINPAYPQFALSAPIMDEYLADGSGQPAAGPPRLSLANDPYFFTNFNFGFAVLQDAHSWAYNCANANVSCFGPQQPQESRSLWTIIATDGDPSLDARMAKLYATALADIPPAPPWVNDIALTNYDYWSPLWPSPNGFEADVAALAAAIPLANRSQVVVCVHGWYGTIGWYSLAEINGTALVDAWQVFPDGAKYTNPTTKQPMGPVNVTKAIVHGRIQAARAAGFRVLMYFADGLNTCDTAPFFKEQVLLAWYKGYLWKGPDCNGNLHLLNPLHPQTRLQYTNYLAGLLDEYGPFIDGFVWDETFELVHSDPGDGNAGGYAARAVMTLIQGLTALVHAHPACAGRCIFVVADCLHEMPNALVADGTYEDNGLNPEGAPFGVLQNWRGPLWQCGWNPISIGYDMGNATEGVLVRYNVPAGIGNGWGDFIGFANMTAPEQSYFIGLMATHNPSHGPRFPPAGKK